MFTPQKKIWPGWSLSPLNRGRSGSGLNPDSNSMSPNEGGLTAGKGKTVTFTEPCTPLVGRVTENGVVDKISQLEKELFEYQYNMGILLIEKKEWDSKYEELKDSLVGANEALKREQTAYLVAISGVEKREESLRNALGVEKECVLNLEKALHEMRSENAEIKFTADSKLAEAKALITSIEEKSFEVEAKLRAADAKLAEVSRKSSEIERKLSEVDSRGSALQRERLSFIAEREAHEATLSNQREDLREWERKLQDGEDRVAKGQMIINQREERANEKDKIIKEKEKGLEEAQKKSEAVKVACKRSEDDINNRLKALTSKEQESDALRKKLELKEKDLLSLEEKLIAREKVEIQKLLDEHNAILDAKKCEFELEIDQKRKSVDENLRSKVIEMGKKETEVSHMEEKIEKREQALEKKLEKLKEKEQNFELKLKALKEREKILCSEEKNLATEKRDLLAQSDNLESLKAEVEKIRTENEAQISKIHEETDMLRITEEERSEYLRLQSELKEQIEKCRLQQELHLKEAEDLKQQKDNFEKEWEELDERKTENEKELRKLDDERTSLEKYIRNEEERLRKEKDAADAHIKEELASLEVAKDSFLESMEHERAALAEKAESERSQMSNDYELQRRKLEIDIQNRQEAKEKELQEREKSFEEEKEGELSNINYLRDVAKREMEEMRLERLRVEKAKQEVGNSKNHLEGQQVEIRKDIDELMVLTTKLKDQREQFIKERNRFLSFVENHKNCNTCGEVTAEFVLSDLQLLQELENSEILNLQRLAKTYATEGVHGNLAVFEKQNSDMSPSTLDSSGRMSWFKKIFSPKKKTSAAFSTEPIPRFDDQVNMDDQPKKLGSFEIEDTSFAAGDDSFDVQRDHSNNTSTREVEASHDQSGDDQSHQTDKGPEVDGPRPSRRGRSKVIRTRSVKAVVQDAKAILGESFNADNPARSNGNAEDSADLISESRDGSDLADKKTRRNVRKRNHAQSSQVDASEHDGNGSEGCSESVATGGQPRKRRTKAAPAPHPHEPRYNFRRRKMEVSVTKVSSEQIEETEIKMTADVRVAEDSKATAASSAETGGGNGESMPLLKKCSTLVKSQDGDNNSDGVETMVTDTRSEENDDNSHGNADVNEEDDGNSHGNANANADEDEDDSEDEETEHPGEASIGKKLWTFFTT